MIRPRCYAVIACCLVAFLQPWAELRAQESTKSLKPRLTVLMEHNSAPFSFIDPTGQPAGFAVELIRAIADDQGYSVGFDQRPWQEVYDDFLAGNGNVLGLVAFSEERAQLMDFSISYETMYCRLYVREELPPIRTVADLKGRRIAVIRKAITHEYLQKHHEWGAVIVECDSLNECLEFVRAGKADIALGMQFVTDYVIRTQGIKDIVTAELELRDMSYRLCFAVHRGDTRRLAHINEGLAHVRQSGAYDRIFEKWLGPLKPRQLRWRELQPFALPTLAVLVVVLVALIWQRRMLSRLAEHADALSVSEERLSLVLEGSQDGFWDWDVRNGMVMRSARWYEIANYQPGEIPTTREGLIAVIHPDDLATIFANEKELETTRDHFTIEFRMLAKTGEWRWILDRGKVVARDPVTRKPLRVAGTHTDVTARKLAEKEASELQRTMQENQRLESLGVLAGGIAHDFNNLLTVIIGNTTLVKLDHGDVPETVDHLDKVVLAANRAADLCRQLLAYAGKGAMSMEQLCVNELLRDTAHLLNHSLNARTTLDLTLAPTLPMVEADPSQLQQIIMNLLLNAADAIGENAGQIRLQTSRVELIRGELIDARPSADIPAGAYVKIEVSDTGCGMAPDTLRQIFDPFFTTKFTGRGLGLPAVLGIVRSLRGALTVRSTPGRGSLFRIYLPALPERPIPVHRPGAVSASTGPAANAVLVAADDAAVRTLLGELLQHVGYEVVLAADAETACTQFEAMPRLFAAVLLDLPPTPLDVRATLQRMQAVQPEVRGVLITDLSERDVRARAGYDTFTGVLQKPFTPESLKACLLRATYRA